MKVYKCDSCGITISDPYEVKMKEFYIATEYDFDTAFPLNTKTRTRIHLCEDCFRGLKEIGLKVLKEKNNAE